MMCVPRILEGGMPEIKIDEALWASSIFPEGTVVRWFIADGAQVAAGRAIAEVRIEDALHEITAPASGRVTIVAAENNVIEPGSLLATLSND
jgi:pyruvate/2-oxoglutarate dehydrogenase complex dihydrolipoamide acyltransferase (E2) component